jgi:hypothetical protein
MGSVAGSGIVANKRLGAGPLLTALTAGWMLVGALLPLGQTPIMSANEVACALVVLVLCGWWVRTGSAAPRWLLATIGFWLLFAPLVFWAPGLLGCLNNLVTGTLLILASAILPTAYSDDHDCALPPGWSYNPSALGQRVPIAVLALLGFTMSGWLAAYQLGYVDEAWDPLFGDGTRRVLTSDISRWFPVSDAGLGAISYLLEAITCFVGGSRRWRTMPWIVLLFGLMIIPTGAVSIVLVVLQPIGVGSWCTLCLTTAAVMLLMVAPALDEVVATWQLLRRHRRRGDSWWTVLWHGSAEATYVPPSPSPSPSPSPEDESGSWPWHLLAAAAAGTWLMGAPYLTGTADSTAGANHHLTGALVVTVAVIALGEIARPLRWLLLPLGLWLLASAWWLPGTTTAAIWSSVVVGGGLLLCAPVRGRVKARFGTNLVP